MAGAKIGKNKIVPPNIDTSIPVVEEPVNKMDVHQSGSLTGETSINKTNDLIDIKLVNSKLIPENEKIDFNKADQQVGIVGEHHDFIEYRGAETDTAKVNVDSKKRLISVTVKKDHVEFDAIDGGSANFD